MGESVEPTTGRGIFLANRRRHNDVRGPSTVTRPSSADLDKFSANLRANSGTLSFWIKRWCNSSSVSFANAGFDDYQYSASNFAYVQARMRERRASAGVERALASSASWARAGPM